MAFLFPLFLLSGVPALLYQVVWQRALFTIYGTNTESATAVVAAFLLGLGLGAHCGGWAATRWPGRLLTIYGGIELTIGLFGLVSLPLFDWVGTRFAAVGMAETGLMAFALVVMPTVLMGATLPILAAYLVARRGHVGNGVGALYFVNTLGSALACFLAADYLMEAFGQHGTTTVAAVLNLFVGLGAIVLGRSGRFSAEESEQARKAGSIVELRPALLLGVPKASLLAAMSGYLSLSFEMLWFRAYAFVSGGSARDFAHLLGFFLLGIALGGLAGRPLSRLASRSPEMARLVPTALLVTGALLALFCAPSMGWIPEDAPPVLALPGVTLVAGIWAALFPVIAHLSVMPGQRTGAQIGRLYLANVIGSVAGCLFTGFILTDHFGTSTLTAGLAVAGVIVAWILWLDASAHAKAASGIGLAVIGVAAYLVAPPLYDRLYEGLLFGKTVTPDKNFTHLVENKGGIIAVSKNRTIYGGGIYDGVIAVDFLDSNTGLFRPFSLSVFHEAPKRVLMIGLSGGAWAQAVANHPQLEELVVVEINPGYTALLKEFPSVASVVSNPKVKIVIDDGRRWMRNHRGEGFDVVVMNTTFHWRSFASNVLSVEFLRLSGSMLKPGGYVYFNATGSAEVHRTGALAFPYALRFGNMMLGSYTSLVPDADRWEASMRAYRIDGRPVVGDDPISAEAIRYNKERISNIDKTGPGFDEWNTIESRDHILARTQRLRAITDDNMGLEWARWRQN